MKVLLILKNIIMIVNVSLQFVCRVQNDYFVYVGKNSDIWFQLLTRFVSQ